MVKENWWRPLPALALLLIAALLSVGAGTPGELPGVALGWPLLLHLERAAVLVAGLGLVVLVGARATMGRFPFRLGQIEYAMEEMTTEFAKTVRVQGERLDALEAASAPPSVDETDG
jgi:hypothetical protein